MKGPLVFLFFAAACLAGLVAVLLPAARQREDLARRVEQLAKEERRPDRAGRETAARLARSLGDPGQAVSAVKALALDFAPLDRIRVDGNRIRFPFAVSETRRLLERLLLTPGLVVKELSAGVGEDLEGGWVVLDVLDPGAGGEVR